MSTPKLTNNAQSQTTNPTIPSILKKPTDPTDATKPGSLKPPTGHHKIGYENPDSSSTGSHQSTLNREGPEFDTDEEEWRKSVFHKHAHWSRKLKTGKVKGVAGGVSEIVSGAGDVGGATKAKDGKELVKIKEQVEGTSICDKTKDEIKDKKKGEKEHKKAKDKKKEQVSGEEKRNKNGYLVNGCLNSPSFFKPPKLVSEPFSEFTEKARIDGEGIYKEWSGIED
ncbi:hypothetical protein BDZ45DRAFT_736170 [Acephala macrosclerotiorum]|nr:hypothetical protein BDZ45DRAFT_736170 [Acephala macrosclerotiorum]